MAERISRREFLEKSVITGAVAVVFNCQQGEAFTAIQKRILDGKADAEKKAYPDRWVRIDRSFQSDKDVDALRELAQTAAQHGLTAIVLSGMDGISLGMPDDLERLRKVKEIADANHLEIIPEGFNNGYG
jgi:hypothetical protein